MLCILGKTIPLQRLNIITHSPSTFRELLCLQTQWLLSVRYSNSIASNGHSFMVSYLIDTHGFSPEVAASASKYFSFETREKPDLVIRFLKNQGFSQTQILHFIKKVPMCLRFNPQKIFLPKIEFFKSRGVSSLDIPKLICSCPDIMKRSLSKQLIPSFDFFQDLFQSDDKFLIVLKNFSGILLDINSHAVPNIKLLREVGVPESNVIKLLQFFPRAMAKNPGRFKLIVEELMEMGFDPLRFQFVIAVYALSSLSKSTWSKKADVYKKWGWSDNDILVAFRRYPFCMKASEDKIDAVMKFLVDKLGCQSSTIARYPAVLSLSLNKRIVPRGSVFQVLLSKGQVKKQSFLQIFICNERDFLKKFILCRGKEASELLKLYQTKLDLAK